MNVASNHSQEYVSQEYATHKVDDELELDEDGEGLVDAPKERSTNYTMEEDVLLCIAWCKVGIDPATSTDQTRDTYWARIEELYDKNCKGV
jgi:hypothetical protein